MGIDPKNFAAPNSSAATAAAATLVIEPGMTAKNYWRDLWHYRELIYFLAWRDTAVRYKTDRHRHRLGARSGRRSP